MLGALRLGIGARVAGTSRGYCVLQRSHSPFPWNVSQPRAIFHSDVARLACVAIAHDGVLLGSSRRIQTPDG